MIRWVVFLLCIIAIDPAVAQDREPESPFDSPPAAVSIKPYRGKKVKIPVPGQITDVVQAGGLRYLALVLRQEKKIALFDTSKRKIEKLLPLSSDDVVVAGTLHHLVIVDRSRNLIEKWSLDDLRREEAAASPLPGGIRAIVAGYFADGPLLVAHDDGASSGSEKYHFAALDVGTFEPLPRKVNAFSAEIYWPTMHLRAGGSGGAFVKWYTEFSSSGLYTILLNEREIVLRESPEEGSFAVSADGTHVFSSFGRVFTIGRKRLHEGSMRSTPCFPTSHPRFYLSVPIPIDPEDAVEPEPGVEPQTEPRIHEVGVEAPLLTLPSLDLGTSPPRRVLDQNDDFTWDKRIFYLTPLNLLISIPFDNHSLVIQSFDLVEEFKGAKIDYFFVSSIPPREFEPGETYEYQILVESKKPGIRFELSSGPEGIKVSPTGRVNWKVPRNYANNQEEVIISITGECERQVYETFTIYKTNTKSSSLLRR